MNTQMDHGLTVFFWECNDINTLRGTKTCVNVHRSDIAKEKELIIGPFSRCQPMHLP